mmetsp:Transcript_94258/g.163023  ORF Transcript_94258/g.163023 Transcript_94258/m.163023 type:complete len:100 (+) Transcript_94258:660-959(+)
MCKCKQFQCCPYCRLSNRVGGGNGQILARCTSSTTSQAQLQSLTPIARHNIIIISSNIQVCQHDYFSSSIKQHGELNTPIHSKHFFLLCWQNTALALTR